MYARAHKQGRSGRYQPTSRQNTRTGHGGAYQGEEPRRCRARSARGPQRRQGQGRETISQETPRDSQESRRRPLEKSPLRGIDFLSQRDYLLQRRMEATGFEPAIPRAKSDVLPIKLRPPSFFLSKCRERGNRTPRPATGRRDSKSRATTKWPLSLRLFFMQIPRS